MENLETIIHNLQAWKDLCIQKDSDKIAQTLNQGIGFNFLIPHEMSDDIHAEKMNHMLGEIEPCYHAYVGVSSEGTLNYYMIHSVYDTEEQFDKGIRPYIIECEISNQCNGDNDTISDKEAARLIGNWKIFHNTWIPLQTVSKDGMYRAFTVPDSDIPVGKQLKGFFALKENLGEGGDTGVLNFTADLVFWDPQDQVVLNSETFSDLARPVPPFKKGTVTAEDNFYLLTCPVPNEYL